MRILIYLEIHEKLSAEMLILILLFLLISMKFQHFKSNEFFSLGYGLEFRA